MGNLVQRPQTKSSLCYCNPSVWNGTTVIHSAMSNKHDMVECMEMLYSLLPTCSINIVHTGRCNLSGLIVIHQTAVSLSVSHHKAEGTSTNN